VSRKKRKEEHANHERWLVSYADFITLLFAFFVVLYSSAQVDKRRVGQLSMAIQVAFQEMGIFESSNSKPELANSEPMPFSNVQMIESAPRVHDINRLVPTPPEAQPVAPDRNTQPDRGTMDDIQKELEESLATQIRKHTVTVTPTKEGIVVSLREIGFFDSGSVALRPDAHSPLAAFVSVIAPRKVRIRIEGHTDNVPIHNSRFDSNWELSTARATEIIKLFITRYSIAPERLSASGYGEYYPVASNDTPEGRAKNRRVDLIILNSYADTAPVLAPPQSGASKPPPQH
jgi:chemotaxis protein MotB